MYLDHATFRKEEWWTLSKTNKAVKGASLIRRIAQPQREARAYGITGLESAFEVAERPEDTQT
jgi:hypothetical protein